MNCVVHAAINAKMAVLCLSLGVDLNSKSFFVRYLYLTGFIIREKIKLVLAEFHLFLAFIVFYHVFSN
jgi:hypothetical protein